MKSLHLPSPFSKLALSLLVAAFLIVPQPAERPALAHDSGSIRIDIETDGFEPVSISIQAGATVQWRNKEHEPHSVADHGGAFSSGIIPKEGTYSYTFNTPGTYYYMDMYNSAMGTITVLGAAGAPASVTPPPPGPTATPSSVSPSAAGSLTIGDDFFSPTSFSTTVGATVTWSNTGSVTHSVTSDTGLFDSGMVKPGQSFSYTFQTPGTYTYHCLFHGGQTGTIIVTGSAAQPANTVAPASTTPASTVTPSAASGATPSVAPAPSANNIRIGDNLFAPAQMSVVAGSKVTWTNSGTFPHTVTSDTGLFDSGMLKPGQSFSFSFLSPGTYAYHCAYHPGQNGTIAVTDGGSPVAVSATVSSGNQHDVHISVGSPADGKISTGSQTETSQEPAKGPPPPPPTTIFSLEPKMFLTISALAFLMVGLAFIGMNRKLG